MSHPDPNGAQDRRPIKVGEVWENPVTGERSVILERPWVNPASRVTGELTALVGARVTGEHRHPALVEQFTVLEGALSIFEIWWTRGDSNPRPPHCEGWRRSIAFCSSRFRSTRQATAQQFVEPPDWDRR
jgi:hypothetical protein